MNIGAIGSSSDGGIFERCGMKDALYNVRLSLPDDCDLPKKNTTCSYPVGRHVMRPYA